MNPRNELTNLLPSFAIRKLRRTYFMRLITVAAGLLVVALVIHGVLLMPSYVQARIEASREQAELDQLSQKAESSEEKNANARIQGHQDRHYIPRQAQQASYGERRHPRRARRSAPGHHAERIHVHCSS